MTTYDGLHRTNWSGNVTYSAREVARPTDVAELQEVVAAAAAAGDRVRAIGSRHSFSTVADTDGLHVDTRDLGLGVELEDGPEGPVAVVPGAATYAEVAPVLHARGRALHNLGSLPHISVAGACATGTHGSGDDNGSLSTAVTAVELVTAGGDLVRIGSEDPDFGGVVLSLGALGVVTRLWLRTEPTYDVRQRVWVDLPAVEVAEQLPAVLASGASVSVFTDLSDPGLVTSVWVKERVGQPRTLAPCLATRAPATRDVHPVPGMDPVAASPQQGEPGPWHERLPHFRAAHLPSVGEELQSELFLPRDAAPHLLPTIAAIRDLVAPALLVHEIRSIARDDLWLSPFRGRDTVAAHFTWRLDPGLVAPALRAVEDALAPWEPRTHWGKTTATPELRGREGAYDRAAFEGLRARLDPDGVFRNDLLGP